MSLKRDANAAFGIDVEEGGHAHPVTEVLLAQLGRKGVDFSPPNSVAEEAVSHHVPSSSESQDGVVIKVPASRGSRYTGFRHVAGNGTFGCILKCHSSTSPDGLVIKRQATNDLASCEGAYREVRTLLHLAHSAPHPCIVSLVDTWWLGHHFYIAEEALDVDLSNYILDVAGRSVSDCAKSLASCENKAARFEGLQRVVPLDAQQRGVVIQAAYAATGHLHRCNILHRDIKPENICLKLGRVVRGGCAMLGVVSVKFVDLGSCRRPLSPEYARRYPHMTYGRYVTTYPYRAPEITGKQVAYGCAVDVWSLGCVVAELLLGRALFPGVEEALMQDHLPFADPRAREVAFFEDRFPGATHAEHLLLHASLQYAAGDRPSADGALAKYNPLYQPSTNAEVFKPEHYDYEDDKEVKRRLRQCIDEFHEWHDRSAGASPGYSGASHDSNAVEAVAAVSGACDQSESDDGADGEAIGICLGDGALRRTDTPPPCLSRGSGAQSAGLTESTSECDTDHSPVADTLFVAAAALRRAAAEATTPLAEATGERLPHPH